MTSWDQDSTDINPCQDRAAIVQRSVHTTVHVIGLLVRWAYYHGYVIVVLLSEYL